MTRAARRPAALARGAVSMPAPSRSTRPLASSATRSTTRRSRVRRFGSGPRSLLIHGFPVHGYTWRALLAGARGAPHLLRARSAGLGDSDWSDATDFRSPAQARRLSPLLRRSSAIERFALLAHDTGATVARLLALAEPGRVAKLAILNTEIPGHRPPWIPLYQKLTARARRGRGVPRAAAAAVVRALGAWASASSTRTGASSTIRRASRPTSIRWWRRRGAWRACCATCAAPSGARSTRLRTRHAEIKAPVLLLWGEDDATFPVALARADAAAVRRADDVRAHPARVADAARRAARRRARVAAPVPGGPLTPARRRRFLERFRAFGAQPDVARYLALFHPDATLFDSGMQRPITVPEIPEHIEGDPEAGARFPHDARALAAARADDLRRGAQPGDAARARASSGRRSTASTCAATT